MATIASPDHLTSNHASHHQCQRNRHVMVVCTGEQCKEHGARELLDELREARRQHEGDLRVSSAKCIGHCTAAPAVIEDGSLLRWVSLRRLRSELIRLGIL